MHTSEQENINALFNQNAQAFSEATEQHVSAGTYKRGHVFLTKLKSLVSSENIDVLDYGCGTGRMCIMLGKEGYRVTGIDPAIDHIKIANAMNHSAHVQFKLMNTTLEEPSLHYDAVVSSSVFEFVPDAQQYIKDIHDVLKLNGILLISIPNTKSWWRLYSKIRFGKQYNHFKFQKNIFTEKKVRMALEQKGFKKLGNSVYYESAFDQKGLSVLNQLSIFGTLTLMAFRKIN